MHLSVRYRVRPPLAAELLYGQATAGKARGNRNGDRLDIRHDATMLATLLSIETNLRALRRRPVVLNVGLGPAVLRTKWQISDGGFTGERTMTTSIGAIGNVGVVLSLTRLVHVNVTGQYRWFGTADADALSGSFGDFRAGTTRAHGFAGLGLGVTF